MITLVTFLAFSLLAAAGKNLRAKEHEPAQAVANTDRFDMQVREDFFTGFAGDAESLARGMKKCEEALAKEPKNAEAMVWHGAGLSFGSKRAFVAGDPEKGRQIRAEGEKQMNEAVALRPDDIRVLVPRATVFLAAAVHVPSPEVAKKDFRIAADDYEKILRLQSAEFLQLSVHSRGELLGGLAEAWNGLGETEKSRVYLKRISAELPGTSYARRADELMNATPKSGALGTTCLGCHVAGANQK